MAKIIPKISGMDWITDQFKEVKPDPDEFSTKMVAEKLNQKISVVNCMMQRKLAKGEITKRTILVNGRHVNFYKQSK
jgi:predicted transcriptional regulator